MIENTQESQDAKLYSRKRDRGYNPKARKIATRRFALPLP